MKDQFAVKFWGVRGSYPVAGASALRFGGNTSCVEIRVGGQTVVLDAGTGVIGLGRELTRRAEQEGKAVSATIFFSHMHHDHTQGIPFFEPLRDPASRLNVVAPAYLADNAQHFHHGGHVSTGFSHPLAVDPGSQDHLCHAGRAGRRAGPS